jgi:hypothetical protein
VLDGEQKDTAWRGSQTLAEQYPADTESRTAPKFAAGEVGDGGFIDLSADDRVHDRLPTAADVCGPGVMR